MRNKQALTLLITANIISGFAQGITMLSIPWYFVCMLDKGSLFGVIYTIITIGTLFWSLYAGTLIDRYSRKNVFLFINVSGAFILGSVALSGYIFGNVSMALVITVFAATIFIYNIHYPALYAFGQEIAEKHNYGKINSYFEIQGQATTVFSGALGAILLSGTKDKIINLLGFPLQLPFDIKRWEMHEIFLFDAITYAIAIILILLIKYVPTEKFETHLGSVKERMKMGFNFLNEHRLIFYSGTCHTQYL